MTTIKNNKKELKAQAINLINSEKFGAHEAEDWKVGREYVTIQYTTLAQTSQGWNYADVVTKTFKIKIEDFLKFETYNDVVGEYERGYII